MLDDIIRERKKKLARLKEAGIDPYPARAKRTSTLAEARAKFAALARSRRKVFVAGRIMGLRDQGGLIFLDLMDESGNLQVLLKKATLKEFSLFKQTLDIGDFISVGGTLFKTKKGEQSVEAKEVTMLAKSVRPVPSGHYSVEDIEILLRQRYLDLTLNRDIREMFRRKSIFWQTTRQFMLDNGFMEVETPILEAIPGGAEAEPFVTHHNALDTDFYLRISPELNLKRLMVGGFEKVFELGRIFRNEGIDAEHLQDYTQMEMYWAYQDYNGLMKFVEKLVKSVIKKTFGTLTITRQGQQVNWGGRWERYDYYKLFKQHAGLSLQDASREDLLKKARSLGLDAGTNAGRGRLIDLIFKKTVRPLLVKPGFLTDPPVDIEPLAKRMPEDNARVERFQIVAYGTELGKGFSELNDPEDQRKRFEDQMRLRGAGDKEAQMMDEDYVIAMEYGMPPTAGFAYSDRLFSVLTGKPIRETVFFPLMKSKH